MDNLILRPYQDTLLRNVRNAMEIGNKRVLAVLPTGGGKTAVFARMAGQTQAKGNSVWFLVHRKELLEQTQGTFDRFAIPTDNVMIGMVGTVANKLDRLEAPSLIVFDEAHHSRARTWGRILDRYPDTYVVGLTATPTRLDGKPMGDVYDALIEGPATQDLIDQGYLSPYRQIVSDVGLKDLRKRAGEYIMRDAETELMTSTVYGDAIETYRKFADGMQAIYFCVTVKHSEATAAEFNKAGIRAEHFDAKTPKQEREEIVDRFRAGQTQVLTNVDLIGEGFDMPACDCVGMLRPTASLSVYLQQAGRALRPRDGKTAVLIDHVGNVNRHGLPTDRREWSLASQLKTGRPSNPDGSYQTRQCKSCYAVFGSGEGRCPICKALYIQEARELQQMAEVEMLEIEVRRKEQQQQQDMLKTGWAWTTGAINDARTFYDLAEIGRIRGYKPGWAYHQARQRGMYTP